MPEMGLKGSVAIVTGAGALGDGIGNGRAASILLAREGMHVALLDLERAAAERTHAMIESEGGSSVVLACDVTDPKACERAVGDVVARWGGLDVLVNNVGVGGPRGTAIEVDREICAAPHDQEAQGRDREHRLRGRPARRPSQPALCDVEGRDRADDAGDGGEPWSGRRSRQLRRAGHGLHANGLRPRNVGGEKRRKGSLLQVEGTGWDVGRAVVYLASEQARWLTGVVLPVDAGTTAGLSLPRYQEGG